MDTQNIDSKLSFKEFLATHNLEISAGTFLADLLVAVVLAQFLALVYVRYGPALSNRDSLARVFVPIAATTTLVIVLVKTSLALSLGLVGALSIVRFRTAIKDPTELAYLFLCIAIGIGCGADQLVLTLLAFAVIVAALFIAGLRQGASSTQSMMLSVQMAGAELPPLQAVVECIAPSVRTLRLRRFEETEGRLEALFHVDVGNLDSFAAARAKLLELRSDAEIALVDSRF